MEQSSGGIGFLGLLTIVFVVLKLTHVIAWSWFWVLCPLYPALLLLAVALGIGLVAILGVALSVGKSKKR